MENTERRSSPRAPIQLKVVYQRSGTFCEDYSENISAGGMFLRTTATMPTGTEFELSFHIPGIDEVLHLRAEVARVIGQAEAEEDGTEPGIGLRFIHESDQEAERIGRFVDELRGLPTPE